MTRRESTALRTGVRWEGMFGAYYVIQDTERVCVRGAVSQGPWESPKEEAQCGLRSESRGRTCRI